MVSTAGYEYTQPHTRAVGYVVLFYFCIIHDSASVMKGGAVSEDNSSMVRHFAVFINEAPGL